jgi:hypothetical protein
MFAKAFSFGGLAVVAAATVLWTAEPGPAAPPVRYFRGYHGYSLGFHGGYSVYVRPSFGYRPYSAYHGGYGVYRLYSFGYRPYYPYYGGYPYYVSYYDGYRPYYAYSGSPYSQSYSDYGMPLYVPAGPVLSAEEKDVRALFVAGGLPTDEGLPVWPLALRVLPGQEAEAIRGQIDGLLQTAATQAARGRPNPAVAQELAQATDRLRKLLVQHRDERGGLARTSYEEAERFLNKLEGAHQLFRVELAPALSGSGEGKGGGNAPDYRP